jgi:UDP-N-acetylmuramoylalanine--D-glutamate ligase
MKPLFQLEGKNVLVIGLARTGIATAEFCAARGAHVTVIERQPESAVADAANSLRRHDVRVECGGDFPELFSGAELIVPSPGVSADLPAIRDARGRGIKVWSEIELAWRFLRGRLVAVTGSNGKTTTTALLGHIFNVAGLPILVGGNIGTPLISLAGESTDSSITVAEVSSFQLELIESFRPDVAVMLNLTPDHLDRHVSFENYARAKWRIFENQRDSDAAVLNADDEGVAQRVPSGPRIFEFSRQRPVPAGAFLRDGSIILRDGAAESAIMRRDEMQLPGTHNIENVLAAVVAARLAGLPDAAIAQGVRTFTGVEHRLEFVAEIAGVRFYNDSKATNVDAACKALASFNESLHVILGGKDKDSDYTTLREPLRRHAARVFLIGAAAEKIAEEIGDVVPMSMVGTLQEAVSRAFAVARPGEIVLLAPACASFDQFRNFEHRGEVFKQLVAQLMEHAGANASARKG